MHHWNLFLLCCGRSARTQRPRDRDLSSMASYRTQLLLWLSITLDYLTLVDQKLEPTIVNN